MNHARQTSPSRIVPMEAATRSKLRDPVLIASVTLAAFVLGWMGGSNFDSSKPDVLKFNASASAFDVDKQHVVSKNDAGQSNTWEAATVTWHRPPPMAESRAPATTGP